jgi:DNA-binding PadR family transcriptional regulator
MAPIRRNGSKQIILQYLETPKTIYDLEPLTGMHPVSIYRVIDDLKRNGLVNVVGFVESPDPRGHKRKQYSRK